MNKVKRNVRLHLDCFSNLAKMLSLAVFDATYYRMYSVYKVVNSMDCILARWLLSVCCM